MDDKLANYFRAGVRAVWYIDPATRSARVYSSLLDVQEISPDGVLDGGDVLPGLRLSLKALFAEADRTGPKK
jgi:Uma2 family endonuclease